MLLVAFARVDKHLYEGIRVYLSQDDLLSLLETSVSLNVRVVWAWLDSSVSTGSRDPPAVMRNVLGRSTIVDFVDVVMRSALVHRSVLHVMRRAL